MANADNKAAILEKYRATGQFKDALKIIAPDPKRWEECEYEVAKALWTVEVGVKLDKPKAVRTSGQYKILLERLKNRLRADIELAAEAIPLEYQILRGKDSWIAEELKRLLKETEQAVDWNKKRARKASRPLSYARIAAVDAAYLLLRRYGKRPTRSREGDWINLARVLFGNEQADLFDYLKPRLERIQSTLKAIAATR
jgi:hypothetical protein